MSYWLKRGWGLWLGCCLVGLWLMGSASFAAPLTVEPTPHSGRGSAYFTYIPTSFSPPSAEPLPPPLAFSAEPPIDFGAVRAELGQQGLGLAFNKIGFHTGMGGNLTGLDEWMEALDAAGAPIFLKSADNAQPLYEAQQLAQQSGVPHVLVFRRTGVEYDVPDYNLPPVQAAQAHWALHKAAWPPELDPSLVWMETVNEVDKNRAEWLAAFALETARLALADGFRWAAFGWSSGEPEAKHWAGPKMVEFLRLAGSHPDRLAIALHEYSFDIDDIGRWYPDLVGRFQALFGVCDEQGIGRPTILITEWGWEPMDVPLPEVALAHIEWAAWLYAAYPQVKGAALWYLGDGFGGIADEAQLLIGPVREYSLSHYFGYTRGQGAVDPWLFNPGRGLRD
jgi:hypothetical protein